MPPAKYGDKAAGHDESSRGLTRPLRGRKRRIRDKRFAKPKAGKRVPAVAVMPRKRASSSPSGVCLCAARVWFGRGAEVGS